MQQEFKLIQICLTYAAQIRHVKGPAHISVNWPEFSVTFICYLGHGDYISSVPY